LSPPGLFLGLTALGFFIGYCIGVHACHSLHIYRVSCKGSRAWRRDRVLIATV
jgi:hypothetical protein